MDDRASLRAEAERTKEDAFLLEVDRLLDFFATQVQLNVSMNPDRYDPDFHNKSKRRAVRSLLAALSDWSSPADSHDAASPTRTET